MNLGFFATISFFCLFHNFWVLVGDTIVKQTTIPRGDEENRSKDLSADEIDYELEELFRTFSDVKAQFDDYKSNPTPRKHLIFFGFSVLTFITTNMFGTLKICWFIINVPFLVAPLFMNDKVRAFVMSTLKRDDEK